MKPIFLFDANMFHKMDIEELDEFSQECNIFLTDDVIKELLAAKEKFTNNVEFMNKMILFLMRIIVLKIILVGFFLIYPLVYQKHY